MTSLDPVVERFAEINGVRLHYRISGEGTPVVLLHGYTQTGYMWHPIVPGSLKKPPRR
jgi:pimeloyl-ACP methyl ester carboxylesterase